MHASSPTSFPGWPSSFRRSGFFASANGLLVALEGPAFVAQRLQSSGWTLQSIITADDLAIAEMIYDHAAATEGPAEGEAIWQPPVLPAAVAKPADGRAAVGLFENYGER
jgi:hypothetical protein